MEYSLIQQSVMKYLLCAMYGVRLVGDSSDQVSQSPVPTLDVTVRGGKVACKWDLRWEVPWVMGAGNGHCVNRALR